MGIIWKLINCLVSAEAIKQDSAAISLCLTETINAIPVFPSKLISFLILKNQIKMQEKKWEKQKLIWKILLWNIY